MKKKGFTIVEMLAVIAILALIIIIAVPTYLKSAANSRESLYQSKIETIKTKAIEYAQDNSIDYTTISVTELVLEGYLSADTDDADNHNLIKNPRDNSSLDCYHVNIRKDSGEYNADVEESTSCELANLEENQKKISIEYYDKDCNKLVGEWKNKDVLVLLNLNDIQDKLTMEGAKTNITWSYGAQSNDKKKSITNVCNPNVDDYANEYFVTATKYLDTTYNVAIPIIYDVTIPTSNGILTKKINVRIDREEPFVLTAADQSWVAAAETEEIDGHKVGKTKKITVMGSDGSGSGVAAYYLTESSIPENNKYEVITQGAWELDTNPTHQFEIDHNGIYYVYVKDNAGNISKAAPISVSGFDTTLPQCGMNVVTSDGEPIDQNTWTNKDVTVTIGCIQGETSGCATDNDANSTQVYTNYQLIDIPAMTIYDNAGNSQACKAKRVQVLIDNDAPVCTRTSVPSDWVNTPYSVSYGCKDVDDPTTSGTGISGCKDKDGNNTPNQEVVYGTKGPYTSGSHNESLSYTISDVAGNVTDCSRDSNMTYTAKVDTDAPTLVVKVNNTNYTDTQDNYVYDDTIIRTVTATDQGSLSGIDKVEYCEGSCTNSSSGWTTLSSMTLNIPQNGTSENKTFRAIDHAGNISNLVHVRLQYKECDNSSYKTVRTTSTGSCSVTCGGGTQTVTTYYKDSYTGTSCSNFTSSKTQSCNTHSCCVNYQGTSCCSSPYGCKSNGTYACDGTCTGYTACSSNVGNTCNAGSYYYSGTYNCNGSCVGSCYYKQGQSCYRSGYTNATYNCAGECTGGSAACVSYQGNSCNAGSYYYSGTYDCDGDCIGTCYYKNGQSCNRSGYTGSKYNCAGDCTGGTATGSSCSSKAGQSCNAGSSYYSGAYDCDGKCVGKCYSKNGQSCNRSGYTGSKYNCAGDCTGGTKVEENCTCTAAKYSNGKCTGCSTLAKWRTACSNACNNVSDAEGYNNDSADYNSSSCRCKYWYYWMQNPHGDYVFTNDSGEARNIQVIYQDGDNYNYRSGGTTADYCYRYVRKAIYHSKYHGVSGDALYHIYFTTKKTGLTEYQFESGPYVYMPKQYCTGFTR